MTPGARVLVLGLGNISHTVNIHNFFITLLLYSQIRHSMYMLMMTKEGSTKIVNFITHRVGVLMLGRNHKSHYSDYALTFYSINIQHL